MTHRPPPLRIGSVCTGYGGLDQAVRQVYGGELAWVSDVDPGACQIISHRMPGTRNLGDLTTVGWEDVEPVDIYIGGYPCQPFSLAGQLKGTDDERHLWPYIARSLRVLRPRVAIFENVANHLRVGFDTVLCDLADIGFDVEWCVVRADEVGAPHQRRRLIFLATAFDAPRPGLPGPRVRGRAAERSAAASDAPDLGQERSRNTRGGRPGPADSNRAAADTEGNGWGEGGPEPAGQQGRPDAALSGGPAAANPDGLGGRADQRDVPPGQLDAARRAATHADRDGREEQQRREPCLGAWGDADGCGPERWGRYGPAVARWEAVTGRRAPRATDDRGRLNPAFVEWMMGLDPGWVTAVPGLTRTQQLKALGNGVVPQQAAAAIRLLAARSEASARRRAS